jgi:hypothetical protein
MSLDRVRGFGIDLDDPRMEILLRAFGEKNVEEAMIFIIRAHNPANQAIRVQPTFDMIRNILEALLGRPSVGEVYLSGHRVVREGRP